MFEITHALAGRADRIEVAMMHFVADAAQPRPDELMGLLERARLDAAAERIGGWARGHLRRAVLARHRGTPYPQLALPEVDVAFDGDMASLRLTDGLWADATCCVQHAAPPIRLWGIPGDESPGLDGVMSSPAMQVLSAADQQRARAALVALGQALRGLTETAARPEGDGFVLVGDEPVLVASARDGAIDVGADEPLRVTAWIELRAS